MFVRACVCARVCACVTHHVVPSVAFSRPLLLFLTPSFFRLLARSLSYSLCSLSPPSLSLSHSLYLSFSSLSRSLFYFAPALSLSFSLWLSLSLALALSLSLLSPLSLSSPSLLSLYISTSTLSSDSERSLLSKSKRESSHDGERHYESERPPRRCTCLELQKKKEQSHLKSIGGGVCVKCVWRGIQWAIPHLHETQINHTFSWSCVTWLI